MDFLVENLKFRHHILGECDTKFILGCHTNEKSHNKLALFTYPKLVISIIFSSMYGERISKQALEVFCRKIMDQMGGGLSVSYEGNLILKAESERTFKMRPGVKILSIRSNTELLGLQVAENTIQFFCMKDFNRWNESHYPVGTYNVDKLKDYDMHISPDEILTTHTTLDWHI